MTTKSGIALVLTAIIAAGIGFAASHIWENRAVEKLTADKELAWNCRYAGRGVAPCPVVYRNTKIEWRDRTETVATPDRRQTERIASLSAELARMKLTIRNRERARRWSRITAPYGRQDGTMMHPYMASDRCPTGSVVVYDAGLSAPGIASRRSGDPNVCYVRTRLLGSRLALSSPQH